MSIATRLEDAKLLYDNGRYEGALLSVLVAAAGTSRCRFPRNAAESRRNPGQSMGDGEAFETFMGEELQRAGGGAVYFRGQCNQAERVFYKWLRCSLAHEAQLPDFIEFRAGNSNAEVVLERIPGPPELLGVTHPVVLLIGHMVATAAENSDVPAETKRMMEPR